MPCLLLYKSVSAAVDPLFAMAGPLSAAVGTCSDRIGLLSAAAGPFFLNTYTMRVPAGPAAGCLLNQALCHL